MRILLAEDDQLLGKMIIFMLKKGYHTVDWVRDGEEAMHYVDAADYDLLILDWMMPLKDGITVCKELREKGFSKGIIILTARDTLEDRVVGLDAGADDYLVKPFEFAELLARIRSLSRRLQSFIVNEKLQIGPFTLSINEHQLFFGTEIIPLTIREFQLLEILMRNYGKTVSREVLLSQIWGFNAEITNNSLDALVKLLRKKLKKYQYMIVQNVRGIGYKVEVTNAVIQNT